MSSNDLVLKAQPTQLEGIDGNIDLDDAKSHKTDINVGAEHLNEKEEKILVQQFDMFKFESKVKQLIADALSPLTQIQQQNERKVQSNESSLMEIDIKTTQAIHAMNKASRGVTAFSDLDGKLNKYVNEDQGTKARVDGEFASIKYEMRVTADTIRKMDAGIMATQKDIKTILSQSAQVTAQIKAMDRFKEDMERFMLGQVQTMSQTLSEKGAQVDRCDITVKALETKCTNLSEQVRNMDASVGTFSTELCDLSEFQTTLEEEVRDLGQFSDRLKKVENDLRNQRMLSEQTIRDTRAALETAITQRDCEKTIFRFNMDMLEKITFELTTDEDQRNHYLPDQLRIDYLKYFAGLAGKLEKHPLGGALDYRIIKTAKQCEADVYRAQLDLPKIKAGPRLDEWGGLRVLSAAGHRQEEKLEEFIQMRVMVLQDQLNSSQYQSMDDGQERKVHFEKDKQKWVQKLTFRPKNSENLAKAVGRDMLNRSMGCPDTGTQLWVPHVEEEEESYVQVQPKGNQGKKPTRGVSHTSLAAGGQRGGGGVGITARDKSNGPPKKLAPEDLVNWGRQSLARDPIMPDGMQFINSKNLVDLKDMQTFKDKFTREIEYLIDIKIEEHDDKRIEEAHQQKQFLLANIAEERKELERKIRDVVDIDIVSLDKLTLKRISNLKMDLDNQIYQVRSEASNSKLEQGEINHINTERLNGQTRVANNLRTETQLTQKAQSEDLVRTRDLLQTTNDDFSETMHLMNSILELQYLSQCLEFQDEADKQQMSLWGLDPVEKNGLNQLVQSQSPGKEIPKTLKIDEDCLACGLEKYRPAIKNAFKMACIQYKPTPVHFNKKRYDRTSVINIKRQMVEDIVSKQIYSNKHYVAYMKLQGNIDNGTFKDIIDKKLEKHAKQIASDGYDLEHDITNLILDAELRKQIIKNEPNMAYLLNQSGQEHALGQYLNNLQQDQRQADSLCSPWATSAGLTTTLDSGDSGKKAKRNTRLQQKSDAYLNANSGLHIVSQQQQQNKSQSNEQMTNQSKSRNYQKNDNSSPVTLAGNWGPDSLNFQPQLTAQRILINDTQFGSAGGVSRADEEKSSFGAKQIYVRTNKISHRGPVANLDQNSLPNGSRESSRAPTRQLHPEMNNIDPFKPLNSTFNEGEDSGMGPSPFQDMVMHSTPSSNHLDGHSIQKSRNLQVWKSQNTSLDPHGDKQSTKVVHQIITNHNPRQNLPLNPADFQKPKLKQDPFSKLSTHKLRKQKDWTYNNSPINLNINSSHQLNVPNFSLNSNLPEIPVIYRSGAISQLQSITRLRQDLNESQIQGGSNEISRKVIESPRFSNKKGHFSSLDKFAQLGSQNSTMKSSMNRNNYKNCQSTGKILQKKFESNMLSGTHEMQKPMYQKEKAKNVTEALSQLKLVDKKALADHLKKNNHLMKKKDNLAVITGSSQTIYPNYEQELAMAQISTLTSQQARGHGTGYMYSQRLIKNLMSPHNPKHIDAQQLIGAKTLGLSVLESQKSFLENNQVLTNSLSSLSKYGENQNLVTNNTGGVSKVETLGLANSTEMLNHQGSKQSVFTKLTGKTVQDSASILAKYDYTEELGPSDGQQEYMAAYASGQTLAKPQLNSSLPILQIHSNISPSVGTQILNQASGYHQIDDISHKQSSIFKFQKGQEQEFYGKQLGKQPSPQSLKKGPFAYSKIASTLKQSNKTSTQGSQVELEPIDQKLKESTGFPSGWQHSSKNHTATDFGVTNTQITQLKDELSRYQKMKRSGQQYNYEPPSGGLRVGDNKLNSDDNTLQGDITIEQQFESNNVSQKTSVLNSNRFSMNVSNQEKTDPPSPVIPTIGKISHNLNPMMAGKKKALQKQGREQQNRTTLNKPTSQAEEEQLQIMGSSTRHFDASQWESTKSPSKGPQKRSQNTETAQDKYVSQNQQTSQLTSFESSVARTPQGKQDRISIGSKTKINDSKNLDSRNMVKVFDNADTIGEIISLGSDGDTAQDKASVSQSNFQSMSVKFPREQVSPTEESMESRARRTTLKKIPKSKQQSGNLDIQQLMSDDQSINIQAGYNVIEDSVRSPE